MAPRPSGPAWAVQEAQAGEQARGGLVEVAVPRQVPDQAGAGRRAPKGEQGFVRLGAGGIEAQRQAWRVVRGELAGCCGAGRACLRRSGLPPRGQRRKSFRRQRRPRSPRPGRRPDAARSQHSRRATAPCSPGRSGRGRTPAPRRCVRQGRPSTCADVLGLTRPERLAEGAAIGRPAAWSSACATCPDGTLTARVGKSGGRLVADRAVVAARQHQGQRAWPEALGQHMRQAGRSHLAPGAAGIGEVGDQRVVPGTTLGGEHAADRRRIGGIRAEPVDGLGAEGDQPAAPQQVGGKGDARSIGGKALGLYRPHAVCLSARLRRRPLMVCLIS